MLELDNYLTSIINGYSGKSYYLDTFFVNITKHHLFKGLFFSFVILWLWISRRDAISRSKIVSLFFMSSLAILAGRVLSTVLPYRYRPLHSPNFDANVPFGVDVERVITWSSFPSDHAVLFISISLCVIYINKLVGLICLLYAILFICLPRVYIGFHFLGDVLIGGIFAFIATSILFPVIFKYVSNSSLYRKLYGGEIVINLFVLFMLFNISNMFHYPRLLVSLL